MFERFTQDARGAVTGARDEAVRAGRRQIGAEHLLIALLMTPGPAAVALTAAGADAADLRARISQPGVTPSGPAPLDTEALASIGIDLDAVRRACDAAFGAGSLDRVGATGPGKRGITAGLRMTEDGKKAIELGLRAAVRLGQRHYSAGHLLLGILDDEGSPALALLADAGVEADGVREDVLRRLTRAA